MKDTEEDEQEDNRRSDNALDTREGLQWRNKRASSREEAIGRGQKKRPKKRSQEAGHRGQKKRRDKKNCLKNKAQDQSSEAATTAMMAVDESDVLLAVSADEESDWISNSGIAYHLYRDREVFSTHVACERLVRIVNNTTKSCWQRNSPVPHGRREIHEGDWGNAAREGRLKSYTDWRGVSRQEELLSDIGPVERQEMLWDTCRSLAKHEKVQPVQDVHGEAQRKETESMRDGVTTTCKATYFAAHPMKGSRAPKSYGGAEPEVVRMDNLKNSEVARERREAEQKCNLWGITGSTQHVAVCRGAGSEGYVFGGSAMVLVRAPRNLTESGLELVGCESKTVRYGER
ncbi:hypothetical protein Acr_22g0006810 [Actinidia rufa]|uniref:Uncharacterized protein n=1 Tax=Actinidia rufa TaxID=165716 RepID=A0A7J0GKE9_9ERIC|nr:hypothetical protein Acr_22g0006810 [Actinidia rufa]